jgi:hypothetical protein
MWVRDRLDGLWSDEDFVDWYPRDGRPGLSPAQLATVCVLQFLLDLSERQAAEAVRCRIDFKYALAMELDDPGFHHSVLADFRERLTEGARAGERTTQRTDSPSQRPDPHQAHQPVVDALLVDALPQWQTPQHEKTQGTNTQPGQEPAVSSLGRRLRGHSRLPHLRRPVRPARRRYHDRTPHPDAERRPAAVSRAKRRLCHVPRRSVYSGASTKK